jgi:hypothetical protein
MNRRQWIATAGAAALGSAAGVHAAPAASIGKKGWAGGDESLIKQFGAHWYYTWWAGGRNGSAAEFVPMIKGGNDLANENAFNAVRRMDRITHLLGYNEPERPDQGNIPLDVAIANWPRLETLAEEKNLRLGSPAPSSDDGGMKYFHAFMDQAKSKKLRIDFIAVHWYRSRDASAFGSFIDDLGKRYRMPVWVTEFNGWSGPERENLAFLRGALRYLERSRHVERYAYFEPGRGKPHSLLDKDGGLTRMGEAYRDAGR